MPIQVIQKGVATPILQNVVYVLPTEAVYIQSLAVVETSIDNSTFTAITASTTGTITTAIFVRCTTGNTTLVCKRAL